MTADAVIHQNSRETSAFRPGRSQGHDPACDCKQCVTAQRDLLLAFTKDVMQAWPEGGIDGGELQDIALAHGLLRSAEPPPEWDGCNFYERTELIE